jgi:hypothetical protein
MSYLEALEANITKAEAIQEIRKHSLDPAEFFAEVGERDEYIGEEILNWLGY